MQVNVVERPSTNLVDVSHAALQDLIVNPLQLRIGHLLVVGAWRRKAAVIFIELRICKATGSPAVVARFAHLLVRANNP